MRREDLRAAKLHRQKIYSRGAYGRRKKNAPARSLRTEERKHTVAMHTRKIRVAEALLLDAHTASQQRLESSKTPFFLLKILDDDAPCRHFEPKKNVTGQSCEAVEKPYTPLFEQGKHRPVRCIRWPRTSRTACHVLPYATQYSSAFAPASQKFTQARVHGAVHASLTR